MRILKSKKGIDLNIIGRPGAEVTELAVPVQVAARPARIPGIRARLKVRQGDRVALGEAIFGDKTRTWLQFPSPGGGRISRIDYGPRRVVEHVVIDLDQDEQCHRFAAINTGALKSMTRDKTVAAIVEAGLWWVFRSLPFRTIPDPEPVPPRILVGMDDREPFGPLPQLVLQDRLELLSLGIEILGKLSREVVVYAAADNNDVARMAGNLLNFTVSGRYPADDPATVLYQIKRSPSENRAWYISLQDLLLMAGSLADGRLCPDRLFTVAGPGVARPGHYKSRLGVAVSDLLEQSRPQPGCRLIAGGILRGYKVDRRGFMGFYQTGLTALPAEKQAEFLALFRPGFGRPTNSRAFFSRLQTRPLEFDCLSRGPERACISCMYCADVCPVDILPQMLHKAILAREVEEYLAHGLLDCVECGLCSYVCPSKIELTAGFRKAKADYARQSVA